MTPPTVENRQNKDGSAFTLPSPWLPPDPRGMSTKCWAVSEWEEHDLKPDPLLKAREKGQLE